MKLVKQEFIFKIPQPFAECHASTIAALDDGSFLCAWFGGEKEGRNDVMIWLSKFCDGKWSEPVCVTEEEGIPHWNPVLRLEDNGNVVLYYKLGYKIWDWKTKFITSCDGGKSWTSAKELIDGDETGGRGPVKNKAITISDGTLLAPASTERENWFCFIDVFDGKKWTKAPIPVSDEEKDTVKMIQPTLWESENGHIHALMRTNSGLIYRSDSEDSGRTWCTAYKTDMPNNNSGIDCVKTQDGKILLVCNPNGADWGKRTPLSLFVSDNNGNTFSKAFDLETEDGEFSYPAIVAKDNKVYITYTHKRKNIVFCDIEL